MSESDYLKYRGKCKEMCLELLEKDPTLTLVRGHYWDAFWGEQPHWWLTNTKGEIVDPTKDQFPTKGAGDYIPFNGMVKCSECGKEGKEEDFDHAYNYSFCSYECHGKFVGVF